MKKNVHLRLFILVFFVLILLAVQCGKTDGKPENNVAEQLLSIINKQPPGSRFKTQLEKSVVEPIDNKRYMVSFKNSTFDGDSALSRSLIYNHLPPPWKIFFPKVDTVKSEKIVFFYDPEEKHFSLLSIKGMSFGHEFEENKTADVIKGFNIKKSHASIRDIACEEQNISYLFVPDEKAFPNLGRNLGNLEPRIVYNTDENLKFEVSDVGLNKETLSILLNIEKIKSIDKGLIDPFIFNKDISVQYISQILSKRLSISNLNVEYEKINFTIKKNGIKWGKGIVGKVFHSHFIEPDATGSSFKIGYSFGIKDLSLSLPAKKEINWASNIKNFRFNFSMDNLNTVAVLSFIDLIKNSLQLRSLDDNQKVKEMLQIPAMIFLAETAKSKSRMKFSISPFKHYFGELEAKVDVRLGAIFSKPSAIISINLSKIDDTLKRLREADVFSNTTLIKISEFIDRFAVKKENGDAFINIEYKSGQPGKLYLNGNPISVNTIANKFKSDTPDTTVISRYPAIESPEEIKVDQEFAVQVFLTEDIIIPGVEIKSINKESAKITEKGQLELELPAQKESEKWKIDVILAAPGFKFLKSNVSFLILPKTGDSTPAVFYLKPEPIKKARQTLKLYVTLWHQGTYLARIVRDITVVNPSFPEVEKRSNTAGKVSSIREKIPNSHQMFKKERKKRSIGLNFQLESPDLTVFILDSSADNHFDKTQIIINSPHLQPVTQTYETPHGLAGWLNDQYTRFAKLSIRGKIIMIKQKTNTITSIKDRTLPLVTGIGRELYRKFAPPAFKQAYWKLVEKLGDRFDSIQIFSNNPILPWEIMKPSQVNGLMEKEFLGLEFKIGRWHVRNDIYQLERPPQSLLAEELIVVAPRYQGNKRLSGLLTEIKSLELVQGYRRLPGQFKIIQALFGKFPQGIIHFAGHGLVKSSPQGVFEYAILLEDLELDLMTWKGLTTGKSNAHPFFFFNACKLGQAHRVANMVDGWAPAVLEKGASGYIGALWPLGDKGAADFAIRFYQVVDKNLKKNPVNIAEVLRDTRKLFLETGDPTYLAYVFYGDPNLEFVRYK